jgi:hypothetical protein
MDLAKVGELILLLLPQIARHLDHRRSGADAQIIRENDVVNYLGVTFSILPSRIISPFSI